MPIAAAPKRVPSSTFMLMHRGDRATNLDEEDVEHEEEHEETTGAILKCTAVGCDCGAFQATLGNVRCCERCSHSWLSHVAAFVSALKSCSSSRELTQVEVAAPSAVFDLVFMVLYGAQAIPVRLKILLDRLLSLVDADTRLSLLDSLGWSMDDYARGYIVQDKAGDKLLSWNMCTNHEEQLILPQFLRYAATKTLVLKMMGARQALPDCSSSSSSSSSSSLLMDRCQSVEAQRDFNSLTENYMKQVLKNYESLSDNGAAELVDGGKAEGKRRRCTKELDSYLNEMMQQQMEKSLSLPEQCVVDLLNVACHNSATTQLKSGQFSPDKNSSVPAAVPQQQQRQLHQHAVDVVEEESPCSTVKRMTNCNASQQQSCLDAKGTLSKEGSTLMDDYSYATNVSPPNMDISVQANGLYYSKTIRNIRRAASRRFHPWNLSSMGTNPLTGKKRVQCRVCLKTYCDKGALKIHISAVHLREMHKCTIEGCNMMFPSRRSRNRHSVNPNPKLHSSTLRRNSGPLLAHCAVDLSPTSSGGALSSIVSTTTTTTTTADPSTELQNERCSSRKRKSDHPTKLEVSSPENEANFDQPGHNLEDPDTVEDHRVVDFTDDPLESDLALNRSYDTASNASSLHESSSIVSNHRSTSGSEMTTRVRTPLDSIRPWNMRCNGTSAKHNDLDLRHTYTVESCASKMRELCEMSSATSLLGDAHRSFVSFNGLRKELGPVDSEPDVRKPMAAAKGCLSAAQSDDVTMENEHAFGLNGSLVAVRSSSSDGDEVATSSSGNGIIMTRCKTASGATIEIPINEKNPRQCSACGKMFQNHFSVKTHYQNVHLKVMHGCTVRGCTAAFPSKRSRDRHSANKNLHRRLLSTTGHFGDPEATASSARREGYALVDGFLANNNHQAARSNVFAPTDLINPNASVALAAASAAFYGALRGHPNVGDESFVPAFPLPVLSPYFAGQLTAARFQHDIMMLNAQRHADNADAPYGLADLHGADRAGHSSPEDAHGATNRSATLGTDDHFPKGH